MSLRAKLIEAGARAIWDEWDSLEDLEALDEDGRANAYADIEIVLDAFLDTLEANEREWVQAGRDLPGFGLGAYVASLRALS